MVWKDNKKTGAASVHRVHRRYVVNRSPLLHSVKFFRSSERDLLAASILFQDMAGGRRLASARQGTLPFARRSSREAVIFAEAPACPWAA